ncbi:hypothetical protein [Amycolatopsis minnesotensis]|uniref:Luciferase-like monooxygenase n=1 Tax=Amycolatopsis minnesotensis TaxID=337894 RepID=A0ABN2RHP3_9PSEU
MSFGLLDPAAWHALHDARRHAAQNTPSADSYLVTALHVLGEDEDPRGDTARDATGHLVLSLLASAADTAADTADTATAPDRYTKLYPGYLDRIAPQDRDLVLPSLIHTLALVGARDDLRTRIATLGRAGVDELLIQPVLDPPAEMAQFADLLT